MDATPYIVQTAPLSAGFSPSSWICAGSVGLVLLIFLLFWLLRPGKWCGAGAQQQQQDDLYGQSFQGPIRQMPQVDQKWWPPKPVAAAPEENFTSPTQRTMQQLPVAPQGGGDLEAPSTKKFRSRLQGMTPPAAEVEEDVTPSDLKELLDNMHSAVPTTTPGSICGKSAWAL